MKKLMKNVIVFVLVIFISIVSISCCCLTETAKADLHYKFQHVAVNMNKCCSAPKDNSGPEKHKECDCEKVEGVLFYGLFDSYDTRISFVICSDKGFFASVQSIISRMENTQNHVFRIPDQIVKNDPPVYLQDSVLRI